MLTIKVMIIMLNLYLKINHHQLENLWKIKKNKYMHPLKEEHH